MCTEIRVNDQHCTSIGALAQAIGRERIKFSRDYRGATLEDEMCLCPVDTRRTAKGLGLTVVDEHSWQNWVKP